MGAKEKETIQQRVGTYCEFYRTKILRKSRKEVAKKDTTVQALQHFERGNSTNMLHLFSYVMACDTMKEREMFLSDLSYIITEYEGVHSLWQSTK